MSQLKKKYILNDAVDQNKIRLDNNSALRGRNAANDGDLNLIKANASDKAQIDLELDMNGQAISNVGNVDGRDVSADGSALDSHLNGGINKHDATEVDYERVDGSKKNIDAASDDIESAVSDLDDAIGALDATPTNYTPADPTIVADHLAAIDSQLSSSDNKTVKISSNDTTPGFLEDKVVSANNLLSIATINDGGDEDTQFTVNQGNIDHGSIAGLADDDHTQYTLADGTRAFTGDQSMGSNKLTNLADGTASADAVNKGQLDLKADDNIVIKKDGSVTYTANQPMGGFKLTGLANPSSAQDSATKSYVDAVAEGLKPKTAVRAATTANITIASDLNVADSIDGVTLADGDRVLVKDQTNAEENGIYIAGASPARASDFDSLTPIDEINGAYVPVQEGTTNAGKFFVQSGTVATLDTDDIDFVFFNSAATLSGGDGIDITANVISVDHDGEGLQFVSNQLALEIDGSTLSKSASGIKVADLGIADAQISNSAAIAYSKLALSNSIVAGDLTSNSVTTAKINNDAVDKDKINADVAGNGLGQNVDGSLEVNVDDSSIEINTDALRVKALGITNAMLAGSIDDSKLNQITTANKVAGSAVQLNASGALEDSTGLRVRADASTIKINGSNNLEALKAHSEKITLSAGDITNQYVDLAFAAYSAASISFTPVGGIEQEQAVDYTVSLAGGAGGVTRITFAGDLATAGAAELVAADKIVVKYSYL